MTILLTEGFDHYVVGETLFANSQQIITANQRYGAPNNNSISTYLNYGTGNGLPGHPPGQALVMTSGNSTENRLMINFYDDPLTSFCIGFHASRNTDSQICNLLYIWNVFSASESLESTSTRSLSWNAAGALTLSKPTTPSTVSLGYTVPVNQWHYYEFQQIMTGPRTGIISIYVDGLLLYQSPNENIYGTGVRQNTNQFILGKDNTPFGASGSCQVAYDNMYISDGERLGPIYISTIRPSADTDQKTWTPGTGSTNYNQVNDEVANASNILDSYVRSDAVGSSDLYEFENLPNNDLYNILAVTPTIFADSRVTASKIAANIMIDGQEYYTRDSFYESGIGQINKDVIYQNNPSTAQDWTISDVNNIQMGPKRTE